MADDTNSSVPSHRPEGPGRGPRQGDSRDAGGFRIRLSDNEMQAARALQEAFGLRSTVAVLGFALRTLAQQLEAGQLDELVAQQRSQIRERNPEGRGGEGRGGDGRGGERRAPREGQRGGGGDARPARANPFARPSRPAPAPAAALEGEPQPGDEGASPAEAEPLGEGTLEPTTEETLQGDLEAAAPDLQTPEPAVSEAP